MTVSIHSDSRMINKLGKKPGLSTEAQHKRIPEKILFYADMGVEQFGEDLNSILMLQSWSNHFEAFPI